MKQINNGDFSEIRNWIYRNARPLDLFRWQYHFEEGDRNSVLSALAAYQNSDGGFGHALEPDTWNPNSSPTTTQIAINRLRELDCFDEKDPFTMGIFSFLENEPSLGKKGWLFNIPSNNDFPHAPWWTFDKDKTGGSDSEWDYNPTAIIVGFVLRVMKNKNSSFYKTCLNIAYLATEKLLSANAMEPHELTCFCTMFSDLNKSEAVDCFNFDAMERKLKELVKQSIEYDTTKWNTYSTKPSWFIDSPKNVFFQGNQEVIDFELDHIIDSRNKDGIWDITWTWNGYEKEFALSENWWKAQIIIEKLILLRNFERIAQ
jgi:hypothetical protein